MDSNEDAYDDSILREKDKQEPVMAWVEKDLGGIKDIVESQVGVTGYNTYPFQDIEIVGKYRWEYYNTTSYGKHQGLELDNFGFLSGTSGAAHFKCGKNWKIQMLVYTENYDYTSDNIDNDDLVDDVANALGDSYVVFTLTEDGYVSIDVNSDHSGIANFNIRKDASRFIYKDSPQVNNEAKIVVLKTWHWEDTNEPEDTEDELWEEGNDKRNENQDNSNDDDDDEDGDNGGGGGGSTTDTDTDWMDYAFFFGGIGLLAFAFGLLR